MAASIIARRQRFNLWQLSSEMSPDFFVFDVTYQKLLGLLLLALDEKSEEIPFECHQALARFELVIYRRVNLGSI